MKKIILILITFFTLFASVRPIEAIYDPKSVANNKFGIHILFPSEIHKASELVNSSGGDWGYITIPIQYQDRDLEKWQAFMNEASQYHLIPIIRLSTEGYWKNTNVWRKPTDADILDLANFLNSLNWPVKNKYVVLFNEMNRSDEWGGTPPSPVEYTDLSLYAISAFKEVSKDFYMILGGLDNASPNDRVKYMDNFVYLREMGQYNPDVFKLADAITSHSYPNPAFSQPPSETKPEGTSTYKHEQEIVEEFTGVKKPAFILETGWDTQKLPQSVVSEYYKMATKGWTEDESVIAFTPFLLGAEGGSAFDKFSFMQGGGFKDFAKSYQKLTKQKGKPSKTAIKPQTPTADLKVAASQKFQPLVLTDPLSSDVLKSYFKVVFTL